MNTVKISYLLLYSSSIVQFYFSRFSAVVRGSEAPPLPPTPVTSSQLHTPTQSTTSTQRPHSDAPSMTENSNQPDSVACNQPSPSSISADLSTSVSKSTINNESGDIVSKAESAKDPDNHRATVIDTNNSTSNVSSEPVTVETSLVKVEECAVVEPVSVQAGAYYTCCVLLTLRVHTTNSLLNVLTSCSDSSAVIGHWSFRGGGGGNLDPQCRRKWENATRPTRCIADGYTDCPSPLCFIIFSLFIACMDETLSMVVCPRDVQMLNSLWTSIKLVTCVQCTITLPPDIW